MLALQLPKRVQVVRITNGPGARESALAAFRTWRNRALCAIALCGLCAAIDTIVGLLVAFALCFYCGRQTMLAWMALRSADAPATGRGGYPRKGARSDLSV